MRTILVFMLTALSAAACQVHHHHYDAPRETAAPPPAKHPHEPTGDRLACGAGACALGQVCCQAPGAPHCAANVRGCPTAANGSFIAAQCNTSAECWHETQCYATRLGPGVLSTCLTLDERTDYVASHPGEEPIRPINSATR
jgi:hypothetical protein